MARAASLPVRNLTWHHGARKPIMRYYVTGPSWRTNRQITRDIDTNDPVEVRKLMEDVIELVRDLCIEVGAPLRTAPLTDDEVMAYVGKYEFQEERDKRPFKLKQLDDPKYEYVPKRRERVDDWQPHEATVQARYDVARVLERYGVGR